MTTKLIHLVMQSNRFSTYWNQWLSMNPNSRLTKWLHPQPKKNQILATRSSRSAITSNITRRNTMSLALAMYVGFLLLCRWIRPEWKRRAVGYGLLSDISVHVILQGMFGGDADGRAGLLFAGILINLTMHVYSKYQGYEKLGFDGWVRYDPLGNVIHDPNKKPDPEKAKADHRHAPTV